LLTGHLTVKQDEIFKIRYGLEIPSDYDELFTITSKGWWGEGFSYTVYQVSQNKHVFPWVVFKSGRNKDIETLSKRAIEYLQIKDNYKIDLVKNYSYCVIRGKRRFNDYLLVLYENRSNRCYFIEKFAGSDVTDTNGSLIDHMP
jgi:hypothetical protein